MDITDVKRLRGMPPGVVGACSGPSGAPPVAPVAPDRCPCTMPLNTGRGVLHLAREGPTARFRHDGGTNWKKSKHVRLHGEGLYVFSRGVLMYLRRVEVVPILSCFEKNELWCVGAAWGFCFGHHLPRFAVVIFTAIFPLGYPDADVMFR